MSEDVTKELPINMDEKLDQLFLMTRNVITGLNQLDTRMTVLEQNQNAFAVELAALKAGTNPFWQRMHDAQEKILVVLQEHGAKIEQIEIRLQGFDEKLEDGFRKLNDKFEILSEEWFETRADMKHLKRRVTQIETIN